MRSWHVLLIVIPFLGFLSFRVMSLEDRTGLLYEMAESQSRNAKESPAAEHRADEPQEAFEDPEQPEQRSGQHPDGLEGLRARIDRLEALLEGYEAGEIQARPSEPGEAVPGPGKKESFESYVRSVIRNEADRLRDEQLLKYRDSLVGNRARAIGDFAEKTGLSPKQEKAIVSILTEEADRMIERLKQPEVLDDPPKEIDKWRKMFKETDEKVAEVLNAAQMLLFMELRKIEQSALMPWLLKENQ